MDEFVEKFATLMKLLEFNIGLPKPQCEHIKHHPSLNPRLDPRPQNWWKESFDWFIAVDLIPGVEYGPFYILHGDWFWPQTGDPEITDSERKCFFGLEKIKNIDDAKEKYKQRESNLMKYLYEFKFKVNNCFACCNPLMFIGSVKDGTGFQMNPNRLACTAIRMTIVQNKVRRFGVNKRGGIMLTKPEVYQAWNRKFSSPIVVSDD